MLEIGEAIILFDFISLKLLILKPYLLQRPKQCRIWSLEMISGNYTIKRIRCNRSADCLHFDYICWLFPPFKSMCYVNRKHTFAIDLSGKLLNILIDDRNSSCVLARFSSRYGGVANDSSHIWRWGKGRKGGWDTALVVWPLTDVHNH